MPDLDFVIAEFQERELPDLTPRQLTVPNVPRKAAVIVGMRRSGKTFFMYQRIRELLASGIDKRDILYANFEDDRLQTGRPRLLADRLEAFYRFNPAARERKAFLFFDEIQMVPGWPRFARRILDTENASLVLSGSSAKLLSSDVATSLSAMRRPCTRIRAPYV